MREEDRGPEECRSAGRDEGKKKGGEGNKAKRKDMKGKERRGE